MYTKQFEIRWSDLDPNIHLSNSAYVEFMSHTRISFLDKYGIGLDVITTMGLGPVVFYEHIYYFKEVLPRATVTVGIEVLGHSEDGRFIKFAHNFYDSQGKNLAFSEILFSWVNLKTRKLAQVPQELFQKIEQFPKSDNFSILTKEDTRKHGVLPKNLT